MAADAELTGGSLRSSIPARSPIRPAARTANGGAFPIGGRRLVTFAKTFHASKYERAWPPKI